MSIHDNLYLSLSLALQYVVVLEIVSCLFSPPTIRIRHYLLDCES